MLGAARQFPVTDVLLWLGIGVGIVMAAGLIVLWLRKRMLAADRAAAEQGGLLDDLRDMRNRGEISDEEFTAAKQVMAARLAGQLNMKAPVPRPPPGGIVAKPGYDLTGAKLPEVPAPNKPSGPVV